MAQDTDAQHAQQPAEGDKGGSLWGKERISPNQITYLFTCLNIKTAAGIQPQLFIAPLFSVLKNKQPGANPWVSHSLVRGKLL